MEHVNLNKFNLFTEDSLRGIRQNGYLSKFKMLSGYSSAGAGVRNLKVRLQSDMDISSAFLNINSSLLMLQDFDDLDITNLTWSNNYELNPRFAFFSYMLGSDDYELARTIIHDFAQLIINNGDSAGKLGLSAGNGSTYQFILVTHQEGNKEFTEIYNIDAQGQRILWAVDCFSTFPDETVAAVSRFLPSATGNQIITNVDLLVYVRDNYEVMDLMQESLSLQVADLFTPYDLSSILARHSNLGEYGVGVKNDLTSIAATSGLNGVVGYIQHLYKDLEHTEENQQGLIALTSDADFRAISILTGFFNVVSQVVTAIIAVIVAIAGVILRIISVIFAMIYEVFKKVIDADQVTRASNDDGINAEAISPIALGHVDISVDNDPADLENSSPIFKTLISEHLPLFIHSNCGYYIGSSDGKIVRFERHLDLYDRLTHVIQAANEGTVVCTLQVGANETTTMYMQNIHQYLVNHSSLEYTIENYPNQSDGLLSNDDDFSLRAIIAFNLLYELALTDAWYNHVSLRNIWYDYANSNDRLNGINFNDWSSPAIANSIFKLLLGLTHYILGTVNSDQSMINAAKNDITWDHILATIIEVNVTPLSYGQSHFPGDESWYRYGYIPSDFTTLLSVFEDNSKTTDIIPYSSSMKAMYKFPRVGAGSLLAQLIGVAIGVLAVTAVTVALTVATKIKINHVRQRNVARVEAAWDHAKANPDDPQALLAYRKAVRKNNRFATVFGGTKFNKINYWDTSASSTSGGTTKLTSELLSNPEAIDNQTLTLENLRVIIAGQ